LAQVFCGTAVVIVNAGRSERLQIKTEIWRRKMKNIKNIVAAILVVATLSVSTVFADGIIVGNRDGIIVGNRDGIIVGNAAGTPCTGDGGIIVGNRDGIIVGNVVAALGGIIVGNFAGGIIVGNVVATDGGTCRDGMLISD